MPDDGKKLIGWRRKKHYRGRWEKVAPWVTERYGVPITKGDAYQQCMADTLKEVEPYEYAVLEEGQTPGMEPTYGTRMMRARSPEYRSGR